MGLPYRVKAGSRKKTRTAVGCITQLWFWSSMSVPSSPAYCRGSGSSIVDQASGCFLRPISDSVFCRGAFSGRRRSLLTGACPRLAPVKARSRTGLVFSGAGFVNAGRRKLGSEPWSVDLKHYSARTKKSPCAVSLLAFRKPSFLPARDVDHLIRLCLIDEVDGRLSLTALGRQRYQALPRPAARSAPREDKDDAVLRFHLQQARDR